MSQASQQLHALIPRLETFLAKLTGRAREVAAEASAAVAEMRAANDPNMATASYNLQAGITSQIQELAAKGRTVFEQQFGVFANIDDPATEAAYERLEERMDAWEDELEAIGDNAFAATELADAQTLWDRAVADWRAAAARFTCTQCGAPVPVPYLYPVAVYLPCQGCGSNATFTPSSAMAAAPSVAAIITPRPDDPRLIIPGGPNQP